MRADTQTGITACRHRVRRAGRYASTQVQRQGGTPVRMYAGAHTGTRAAAGRSATADKRARGQVHAGGNTGEAWARHAQDRWYIHSGGGGGRISVTSVSRVSSWLDRETIADSDIWHILVMAYIVMAYIVMTCIFMAYTVMAYIVMTCIVMAYLVMAYIVMA